MSQEPQLPKPYCLVVFLEEYHWNSADKECTEIIPSSWILKKNKDLVTPYPEPNVKGRYTAAMQQNIVKYVKKQLPPESEWPLYNIDIRGEAGELCFFCSSHKRY